MAQSIGATPFTSMLQSVVESNPKDLEQREKTDEVFQGFIQSTGELSGGAQEEVAGLKAQLQATRHLLAETIHAFAALEVDLEAERAKNHCLEEKLEVENAKRAAEAFAKTPEGRRQALAAAAKLARNIRHEAK